MPKQKIHRTVFFFLNFGVLLLLLSACARNDNAVAAAAPSSTRPAPVGDPAKGRDLFMATCTACHGPNARGLPHLGKDLVTSAFVAKLSDADLVAFIKRGRDPSDPLNTTGVAMPPKGGNPALSDADILSIVAYLRSIHEPAATVAQHN